MYRINTCMMHEPLHFKIKSECLPTYLPRTKPSDSFRTSQVTNILIWSKYAAAVSLFQSVNQYVSPCPLLNM